MLIELFPRPSRVPAPMPSVWDYQVTVRDAFGRQIQRRVLAKSVGDAILLVLSSYSSLDEVRGVTARPLEGA